jgi:hypothetical protein
VNAPSPTERPSLFTKLNLKDQTAIVVANAPESFEEELAALEGVVVHRRVSAASSVTFAMVFATTQREVDDAASSVASKLAGDAIMWIAYPKGTSKRYRCEFNRDTGWASLGELGFEPVRQVAIDADWSALRFRRVEFISKMTRSFAMTETGKAMSKVEKAGK